MVIRCWRRSRASDYSGLRGRRVAEIGRVAEVIEELSVRLGLAFWISSLQRTLLTCFASTPHTPAITAMPSSMSRCAVADNTHNLPVVLKAMLDQGLAGVIVTGSVFEQDEGAGNAPLRAFSPYGLSKGLTWQY